MDVGGLTAEHLQFCHSVVLLILEKLFNLMILCSETWWLLCRYQNL